MRGWNRCLFQPLRVLRAFSVLSVGKASRQHRHDSDSRPVDQLFDRRDRPVLVGVAGAARHAGLLAGGHDSTFQNKVHLAMQAKGFVDTKEEGGDRQD